MTSVTNKPTTTIKTATSSAGRPSDAVHTAPPAAADQSAGAGDGTTANADVYAPGGTASAPRGAAVPVTAARTALAADVQTRRATAGRVGHGRGGSVDMERHQVEAGERFSRAEQHRAVNWENPGARPQSPLTGRC